MQRNGNQKLNEKREIENYERLLILGQFLTIIGSALLSAGKVLELFKDSKIPSRPILETHTIKDEHHEPTTLYTGRRNSYFD